MESLFWGLTVAIVEDALEMGEDEAMGILWKVVGQRAVLFLLPRGSQEPPCPKRPPYNVCLLFETRHPAEPTILSHTT